MTTIVDLLRGDGIEAEQVCRTEWHSPCPFCGGEDRFSSKPDEVNSNGFYGGGRGICRKCGWSGDGVSYIRKRKGLSFRDACRELGLDPGTLIKYRTGRREWQPEPPKASPGAIWQARAGVFALSCQGQLQRNSEAVEWLQAERGLTPETIRAARLGLNDREKWESREDWGLLPEISQKTGNPKRLWMPGGLVIPLIDSAGQVIRLRIRRHDPGEGSRYVIVSGSSMQAMTLWQDQKAVCVLESELDALLVQQEAGNLIGVVALGSAQVKPDSELHRRLMAPEKILVCLDSDQAGAKAAWGHWRNYQGFKRWPTVRGKDATEQWRAGIPVRAWIEAGL